MDHMVIVMLVLLAGSPMNLFAIFNAESLFQILQNCRPHFCLFSGLENRQSETTNNRRRHFEIDVEQSLLVLIRPSTIHMKEL